MGGKSSSPDYSGAAIAQGEANRGVVRDQTFANRPNQYNPWGSTTWNPYQVTDPATGETTTGWDQTTSLDPRLQEILDKQIAIQGGRSDVAGALTKRMGDEFGNPVDWGTLTPRGEVPDAQYTAARQLQEGVSPEGLPNVDMRQQESFDTSGNQAINAPEQQRSLDYSGTPEVGNPYETRQAAENAVYNQAMSRLSPQFESEKQAMEVKLRNQGLRPGDAAYDAQMGGLGQRQTDATNQALWSANQAGQAESAQMFGQQMGLRDQATSELDRQGQFANQASQNLFGMQSGLNNQQFGQQMDQAGLFNQANQNMYGMQSGLRNQFFNERLAAGQFANQAAKDEFGMEQSANRQNFGMDMDQSKYANLIRQQERAEVMQDRGFSLNEINALLSGQQVSMPQNPSFMGASAAQAAPIYQGTVDQGNFNQGSLQNLTQGVGGLASLGMGFL